jgi:high-affinity Fe2+/Pb2+ permease
MANLVSKNVEKGVTSTVVVVIASALSLAIVKGAKMIGIDVDNIQVTAALVMVISGLIAAGHNWFRHREKPAAAILTPDKKG